MSDIKAIPPSDRIDSHRCLHVYYGYGKGKTTCCIGLALRAAGAGHRVAVVQFDKGYDGETEHYAERNILRKIDEIELHPTGAERMMADGSFRFGVESQDLEEARRGLALAKRLIKSGDVEVVILDEILAAVAYDLISTKDVEDLLDLYDENRRCELVLSGHKVWEALVERADLVTEMRKVRHYYAKGTPARPGIEF
ncbi:MAG: cob(I)yrinic acid a,c-diamide adenosyltransferase [Gemmatimonadetes bacterium]|nr:cob(I)yrinic acid a,c-diamide adenosyltransferase [Gemmatimonadota bacterium]|tara:strand:- start:3823 stop:4413 length:591 start_codon:yes stop_codon:yes gene_type:complete